MKPWVLIIKAIILAGGYGTRISEETDTKPKPMVLLDNKPIIWHLMNTFSIQGIDEFIIAAGYLGNVLVNYVANLNSKWKITVLDTGLNTLTGGRIKQCINSDRASRFYVTYGDGLGNINLQKLLSHHVSMGKIATVTCVRPPARFGVLEKNEGLVTHFGEKRQSDVGWINGGYFVLEKNVVDLIQGNDTSFEMDVMPKLASERSLAAFEHNGFWQPMDTLRERNLMAELASNPIPPWLNYLT
jgi:glucose-1-phosphate cytidylyltransferase